MANRRSLTDKQVAEIRWYRARGVSRTRMAGYYGVSLGTINGICYGHYYREISAVAPGDPILLTYTSTHICGTDPRQLTLPYLQVSIAGGVANT